MTALVSDCEEALLDVAPQRLSPRGSALENDCTLLIRHVVLKKDLERYEAWRMQLRANTPASNGLVAVERVKLGENKESVTFLNVLRFCDYAALQQHTASLGPDSEGSAYNRLYREATQLGILQNGPEILDSRSDGESFVGGEPAPHVRATFDSLTTARFIALTHCTAALAITMSHAHVGSLCLTL